MYATAILNCVVDLFAVSPLLLLVRMVLVPTIVKLILGSEMKKAVERLQREHKPLAAALGVALARKKFMNVVHPTHSGDGRDGWEPYLDYDTGMTCYYNPKMRRSTWDVVIPSDRMALPDDQLRVTDDGQDDFENTVASFEVRTSEVDFRECQSVNVDWERFTDDATGKEYYHSKQLRRSTWTNPARSQIADAGALDDGQGRNQRALTNQAGLSPAAISDGWQEIRDGATGDIYYHNSRLRRNTWTNPTIPAPPKMLSPDNGAEDKAEDVDDDIAIDSIYGTSSDRAGRSVVIANSTRRTLDLRQQGGTGNGETQNPLHRMQVSKQINSISIL